MTTHTLSTKPGDAASPDLCSLDPTELSVSGMSCASCAAKVERALNEQVGVTATVNYATASAYINRDSTTLTVDDLIGVVEGLGYGAEPAPTDNDDLEEAAEADDAAAKAQVHDLKIRFWVSAALALPVMVISMVPAWQFRGWQWVALALTTPVVVWGALPFHRATLTNLRHGTTTMDTLVSLGVLAAYGWSLWALFFGGAGELGMKMDMSWLPATTGSGGMGDMPGMDHTSGAAPHELYLEVAAVVPTFLLGGRWAEARAKRRAGSALRSLLRLGAQEARVVAADGTEVTVPASAVNVGQLLVVRPGGASPPTGRSPVAPAPSMPACSPASQCRWRWSPAMRSPAPRSTCRVASRCVPPGWGPTPSWRAWVVWSVTPRPARPTHNAWPTGYRPYSFPSCS